jgi:hypothetical protein
VVGGGGGYGVVVEGGYGWVGAWMGWLSCEMGDYQIMLVCGAATATATARERGERKRSLHEKRKRHVVAVAGRELVPDSDTSRERMATALAAPGVCRTLASARLTTARRVCRSYRCLVSCRFSAAFFP